MKTPDFLKKFNDAATQKFGRFIPSKQRAQDEFLSAKAGLLTGYAGVMFATPSIGINIALSISAVSLLDKAGLMPRLTGFVLGIGLGATIPIYNEIQEIRELNREIEELYEQLDDHEEEIWVNYSPLSSTPTAPTIIAPALI